MTQGSAYAQLHRNIVINADVYGGFGRKPRILAAGYGFEGIMGIPGLISEDDIAAAYEAGAGVVSEQLERDPAAPFRTITTGASGIGIALAGFSDSSIDETYMDAMPIEFSHPVLPSTVVPDNFRVLLNTGDEIQPYYVALNPNYDLNERQTVVAFGDYGNRLPSSDPDAIHPVEFNVVASENPLKLITPDGLVNGTGLMSASSNPYDINGGPTLVAAKLSRLSLAGDYPSVGFTNSIANHGVEYYGTSDKLYRLRLFTSGGFSPNGVSGFKPTDFEHFFQLQARNRSGSLVTLSEDKTTFKVKGGKVRVLGIADLGSGLTAEPEYTYLDDYDNQLDLIIRASTPKAAKALKTLVIPAPDSAEHNSIYNPGGPGTDPQPGMSYSQPSGGQTIAIEHAINNPATVSWAAQRLKHYDRASDLTVAFRLEDPITGEQRLTSDSGLADSMIKQQEWTLVDVPFATNAKDSYAVDVIAMHNRTLNDTAYVTGKKAIKALKREGYRKGDIVFTAYDRPLRGLDAIDQLRSPDGQHRVTGIAEVKKQLLSDGWTDQGVAFYSVIFPNAAPSPAGSALG